MERDSFAYRAIEATHGAETANEVVYGARSFLDEVKRILDMPPDPFWELERDYAARPLPSLGAGTTGYARRKR